MKNALVLMLLFSLTGMALGQNAHVVVLSPAETAKAKVLFAEQAQVDGQIRALRDTIMARYLLDPILSRKVFCVSAYGCSTKPGWENGFDFSTNFMYIVPKPPPVTQSCTPMYKESDQPTIYWRRK